jgi:hypothetical protein
LSFFIEEPKSNHFAGKLKSFSRRSPKAPADFFGPDSTCVAESVQLFPPQRDERCFSDFALICFLVSAAMSDAFGRAQQK